MTNTQSKTANVIGGKSARACDSCLRKRARWFCAADDAFLCQSCDTSVHSANLLASRHERVRLETASWKNNNKQLQIKLISDDNVHESSTTNSSSWHQGFTKKPRTPRRSRRVQQQHDNKDDDDDDDDQKKRKPLADLVPEISSNEDENEEEIERDLLLYRVPVLDPLFATDICNHDDQVPFDMDHVTLLKDADFDAAIGMEIPGFISTDDIELQELNSLLGNEIEEDSCGIKGLLDNNDCFDEDNMLLKIEEENQEFEASESFNWDFDYSKSPIPGDQLDEDLRIMSFDFPTREDFEMMNGKQEKKKIKLKINYEQVIAAWDCQGCPWTNGVKPDFSSDDSWPDFMETGCGMDMNGENVGKSGHGGSWDREREARVLRYKEKRRKRLFAKKIRYEVRKLNAEKRPRLKGRFVKRTSFVPSSSSSLPTCYMMNNNNQQ